MGKKKNKMKRGGHSCRICGRRRSNEKFSGKGHRNHICRDCAKLPRVERDAADQVEEIYNFLNQSRISEKNIARLEKLIRSGANSCNVYIAEIVLEVAKFRPYKKRRLKILARQRPDLFRKLEETGLVWAHGSDPCDMPIVADEETVRSWREQDRSVAWLAEEDYPELPPAEGEKLVIEDLEKRLRSRNLHTDYCMKNEIMRFNCMNMKDVSSLVKKHTLPFDA